MTQLLIYSEDGSTCSGNTYDTNMVSRLDRREAGETWQVGYVSDSLAIRLKSVSSLNALLRRALDGDIVEITYRLRTGGKPIQETRTVRLAGHGIQPMLMARDEATFSDDKVVRMLNARWGEYIDVRYRLLSAHGAQLKPIPDLPELAEQPFSAASLR